MFETDPPTEWPRLLRPLVRRGWLPRRRRRDEESNYIVLMVLALGPVGIAVMLLATPIWLSYIAVRWVLRRIGAWDG